MSGLFPNFGCSTGRLSSFGGSGFSSTSTALFSTCSLPSHGHASRNEMIISSPSWLNSVWYHWGSTSTSNISAASKGYLTQMFWSVVFIRITGTLLAFGVTQQLHTTRPCGKLRCTACSTIYYQLFSILEVFPGIGNIAFPGTQIGSLSMLICTVPTGPPRRLLKFWCFFFFIHHLSIQVGSNGSSVHTITFYNLINHNWSNICIAIHTQLGEQQWVDICGHWNLLNTSIGYFLTNSWYVNFMRFHLMKPGSLVFFLVCNKSFGSFTTRHPTFGTLRPRNATSISK